MFIHEATKQCGENSYIRRTAWPIAWRVRPTNDADYHCIVFGFRGLERRFWNPTAEDLEADDWEVIKTSSETPLTIDKRYEGVPLILESY